MASTSKGDHHDYSDSSDSERGAKRLKFKSVNRRENRPQKYRCEWESNPHFKGWLKAVKEKPTRAKCIACDSEIQADLTVLKSHSKGAKHLKNVKVIVKNQPKISTMFSNKNEASGQVSRAEIKIAALISEHNLPINLCDHLIPLLKDIFPDSKIADGKNQSNRYFSEKTNEVTTKFLNLVQCFSNQNPDEANTGATAEVLYKKIMDLFESNNIPFQNIIGFGSDGCNTMFGANNSVVSRLKLNLPGIIVQKCICHSLHLCASEACKVLPRHCEDLVRNIFGYFKNSSKRQAQFTEFQTFCNVEPHKILRPSQTRWLSLLMVVERIIEQWNPLQLYFVKEWTEHRLQASEVVAKRLNDMETKLFFFFLHWILPKFVKLNEYFQSERVIIAHVYDVVCETYKEICLSYLQPNYIHKTEIGKIDPSNASQFIDLKQIYLGVRVLQNIDKLSRKEKEDFYMRRRQFLITSANEMKKRFDFNENILSKISVFEKGYSKPKPASPFPLIKLLPRIVDPQDIEQIQKIDDQWRMYWQSEPNFSDEIKDETSIDKYWYKISQIHDMSDVYVFKELGNFVLDLLVIPHSNAACERMFSKVNLIKTDVRNRLYSDTVNLLLLASQSVNRECFKFNVTQNMINRITSYKHVAQDENETVDIHFEPE
ncbi:unnamed protein product [Acanthoscelides obtectus]|uniref:HAT C-terminal dimerisation domain-containing protein n=1 Tax=Acanthoscelides obtectus TaxID=200917 RepID=A0A9P0KHZ7_ACAOB|nr:unnamed protein product [Acanthoscelides obtectus]CAK1627671.1 Zinc finger protein 862 [Acanthoscelides obtectus]